MKYSRHRVFKGEKSGEESPLPIFPGGGGDVCRQATSYGR